MKRFDGKVTVFLGACAVIIFLQRLHTFQEPLECDTALFSVLAQEWRMGRPLYSDLWDNKPPGIILTYAAAQAVAGSGPRAILFLETLASVLTLLGIYYAAFWMTGDRHAGLWAAAFWTLVNAAPYLEADQPAAEVFVNACWVWGVAWAFRAWQEKEVSRDLWIAGSFLAAAGFYKHHIALVNGIIVLSFMGARITSIKRWRSFIGPALLPLLAPTALLWTAIFSYFTATCRGPILWDTLVTYSRFYAANTPFTSGFNREIFYVLAPLTLLAVVGFFLAFKSKNRRWILMLGYAAAAWAGIILPGRFYAHYYQLLLPPLAMAAGAATSLIGRDRKLSRTSWASFAWPGAIAATLLMIELPFYRLNATEWSQLKYGEVYVTVKTMGEEIGQNLLPGETFYEVGYEPGLYYYSRRRPPTGILMADHWETGPLQKPFTERILQDLQERKPELLITTTFWLSAKGHAQLPLMQWCLDHYRPFPRHSHHGPFLLFARKGGLLEARLRETGQHLKP